MLPRVSEPSQSGGAAPARLRARRLLAGLFVLLGAFLVTLLFAEALVRLLGLVEYPQRLHQSDATNVYVLRPGFRGKTSYGIPLSINALGFRGPEVTAARRSGMFRILLLGDSICFGAGIRQEETFAAVLERALNGRGDGVAYEVLNLGTSGYNSTQEMNLLRMRGLALSPDLVVVAFFSNDIDPFRIAGQIDPRHRTLVKIKEAVRENFELYPFLQERVQRLRQMLSPKPSMAAAPSAASAGFGESIASLAEIRDLAESIGARAFVAILPKLDGLSGNYPLARLHADVLSACAARGVAAADLLPYFSGEDPASLWLRPTDGHPNARGHAIIGRGLLDLLETRSLLSGAGGESP